MYFSADSGLVNYDRPSADDCLRVRGIAKVSAHLTVVDNRIAFAFVPDLDSETVDTTVNLAVDDSQQESKTAHAIYGAGPTEPSAGSANCHPFQR